MKNLEDWFFHIRNLHEHNLSIGLDRLKEVYENMHLQRPPCVITVGGTNGKGSTVALLHNLYHSAGYAVGAYTSPHIWDYHERIRIRGRLVQDWELLLAFEAVEKARGNLLFSFFEFTTLTALWLFSQANLDILILEVGLGGRLDPVNIVDAQVSVLTNVSLDHCDRLGDTREAIGAEKVPIARPHRPFVIGDLDPPQSVLTYTQYRSVPVYRFGQDFSWFTDPQGKNVWRFGDRELHGLTPQLAEANVATALAAAHVNPIFCVTDDRMRYAANNTVLFGRRSVLKTNTQPIIVDVSHNPASVEALVQTLKDKNMRSVVALFNALSDKHLPSMIGPMLPYVLHWFVPELTGPRARTASQTLDYLQQMDATGSTYSTVAEAYQAYQHWRLSTPHEMPLVIFGSFQVLAGLKKELSVLEGFPDHV